MWKVKIRQEARRKLKSLKNVDRGRITEAIMLLAHNPDDNELDIKTLSGQIYWRLRVGQWRIIYDKDDALRIIKIEKIKPREDAYRGDAYK